MDTDVMTLYEVFERTVSRRPENIALEIGDRKLTYSELNAAALTVAAAIEQAGSNAPVVAFLAQKTVAAYQAVIGILAAGKGYVPLQAAFPVDRTSRMLSLSGADILIVAAEGLEKLGEILRSLPKPIRVIPIDIDADNEVLREACTGHEIIRVANPGKAARPDPDAVAYLLFTSGSTGVPKGVPINHHNVLSYLQYTANRYNFQDTDRFSQTFDLTFDLSVHDMFLCWGSGACLVPLGHTAMMAPAKFIRQRELSVWFSVPSVAMVMHRLRQLRAGAFPGLRISLFCGEALSASLAAAWQEAAPASIVENLYGPTEATIAITHYRWSPEDATKEFVNGVVPIGTVFSGQKACIVSADGTLADVGVTGELHLGGSQLSKGYWNNAELTDKAFITLSNTPDRWYRTGDLAREDADGNILYLGRIDTQVQVMGYRVELQEVEHALRSAAGTEMAIAVPWPRQEGRADTLLGVCAGGQTRDATAIKARCTEVLPAYMVPSEVFWIDDMPLNVNGKIDRRKVGEWVEESLSGRRS